MTTSSTALELLNATFGHPSFRANQQEVIECLESGRHALVMMPTGMGKSVCYQVPALQRSGLTLVISPLIALMQDQVASLQAKGVDAAYINSALSPDERQQRHQQLAAGHFKLLYVTPERFRKQEFLKIIGQRQVELLAVDEAHCISQWGHDFRPDYSRLADIRQLLGQPLTIALTATATPEVQQDIISQLSLQPAEVDIFNQGIERPNLQLNVNRLVGDEQKLAAIRRQLVAIPGNCIIYFTLIKTLERFSELLKDNQIPHLCYHGGLEPRQRRQLQQLFMAGDNGLILATNAFGMGIDKEDIRAVIHAEIPASLESYYQEIGRAGRDGKPASCLLLYDQDDLLTQMNFIKWNNPDHDFYRQLWQAINDDPEEINHRGLAALKESLLFKQKGDFRLETALGVLERYEITSGSLERRNLRIKAPLPPQLARDKIAEKMLAEQKKLHLMVQYCHTEGCRKAYINGYFGASHLESCGTCDTCRNH